MFCDTSGALAIRVESFDSDFATALGRRLEIATASQSLAHPGEPPATVSLRISKSPTRTFSFHFAEVQGGCPLAPQAGPSKASPPALATAAGADASSSRRQPLTRIKPPGDIIKLEDRLYYV